MRVFETRYRAALQCLILILITGLPLAGQSHGYIITNRGQQVEGKIKTSTHSTSILLVDGGKRSRVSPKFVRGYVLTDKNGNPSRYFDAVSIPKSILPRQRKAKGNYLAFAEKLYEGRYIVYKKDVYIARDVRPLIVNTYFFIGPDKDRLEVFNFAGLIKKMEPATLLCSELSQLVSQAMQEDVAELVRTYEQCILDLNASN